MASPQELTSQIQSEVDKFNEAIPSIQKQILVDVEDLVKSLDTKNGNLQVNARNLRIVSNIKAKIETLILKNKGYKEKLKDFIQSFDKITAIQNQYFESLSDEYTPPKLLTEIRNQAKDTTYESLTRAGIGQNLSKPISDILRVNITTGAKYSDMVTQLRDYITTNASGTGALERYSKQITNDSLNFYARTYGNLVSNDLGLSFYQYTGALIQTSRPFCQAMHKKRYFHKSEVPDLLNGNFPEFDEVGGKLSDKTGLPAGMIDGTNEETFFVNLGGYFCGHIATPVNDLAVPENIRKQFV